MSNDGNNVIPFDRWTPASADVWKDSPIDPGTFTAGIGMSWPIMTIRGKEFGWRFRGIEHTYTSPDPRAGGALTPETSIEVVLVASADRISKVYYEGGWVPNERKPPTCWSADGITPDAAVAPDQRQNGTCRQCPQNVVGSVITDAGKKAKKCSDNKRLAVVTLKDLANADFGGPFMLRLPPGSFSNYTPYVSALAGRHYHPHMVVTRLGFESGVSHPKVTFAPVRPLTNEEARIIIKHQKNPVVGEMLNDKAVGALLDPEVGTVEEAGAGVVDPLPPAGAKPAVESEWDKKVEPIKAETQIPKNDPMQDAALAKIKALEAQLVAAEKAAADAIVSAPEPEPEPVLTPEQLRIRELEIKLAAFEAKKKPGRPPRSKPVGPPETTVVTQASNGQDPEETSASDVGNDLNNRIARLTGQKT